MRRKSFLSFLTAERFIFIADSPLTRNPFPPKGAREVEELPFFSALFRGRMSEGEERGFYPNSSIEELIRFKDEKYSIRYQ